MTPAARLAALGLHLPKAAAPVANYVGAVRTGNLVFVSGQLPLQDGKLAPEHVGKLAPGLPLAPAQLAAQLCALNVLAQLEALVGSLDVVARVVRLGGFFAVDGSHESMPQAMNGASDLMAELFGERGRHARTTVGVAHLPLGAICEVEGLFEIGG